MTKIFIRTAVLLLILSAGLSYAADGSEYINSYNRGIDLYMQGEYRQASKSYKYMLKEDEKDVKVLNNLACAYIKDKKYNQAVIKLKSALQLEDDIQVKYNLAIATYQRGTYEECEKYVNEVIEGAGRDYKQISLLSGLVSYQLLKYDNTVTSLKYYLTKKRMSPEALLTIGMAQIKRTNYNEAIDAFHDCIELEPDNAHAFYNQANAYLAMEEYSMALDSFKKASKIDPKFAESYFNAAVTYLKLKEYRNSAQYFKKYLKADPSATDKREVFGYIKALEPA